MDPDTGHLLHEYSSELFIEIGPGPTLTDMATRNLKANYEVTDNTVSCICLTYCHTEGPKETYYQFEGEAGLRRLLPPRLLPLP
jgi:fatty acid synthase subunit alpha, fungi type